MSLRHIILFDTDLRAELMPLTLTRPVSEIRWGILTNREKWDHLFDEASFSHITSDDLEPLFPISIQDQNTLINSSVLPSKSLCALISNLQSNEALMLEGELIAAQLPREQFERLLKHDDLSDLVGYEVDSTEVRLVKNLWDLTDIAQEQVGFDLELLGINTSLHSGHSCLGRNLLYIHPTAIVERVNFNTQEGPIYVGENATIMDGANLRGPLVIGNDSVVRMGANLYAGTVIGEHCIVGGEIKKSLFLGHSNKAHEGYLGDSVIGEWCNLGALTTASNLKNTYSNVKVWHAPSKRLIDSKKIKCGIVMGDFTRTAIHTRLNAGTVIGLCCHLFEERSHGGYIPSFSWGLGAEYRLDEAMTAIQRSMALKGKMLDSVESDLIKRIYVDTTSERNHLGR